MWKRILFTLGGALLGAVVGHLLFVFLMRNFGMQGFAIPGAFVALGACLNKQCPSRWVAVLCGVIAFLAGNYTVWTTTYFPWAPDAGFGYALLHFFERKTFVWVLILLATAIALWMTWRRCPPKSRT